MEAQIVNDFTIQELHDNLNAKVGSLESQIVTLSKEVAEVKAAIKQTRAGWQRASEDRRVSMEHARVNWQRASEDRRVPEEIAEAKAAMESKAAGEAKAAEEAKAAAEAKVAEKHKDQWEAKAAEEAKVAMEQERIDWQRVSEDRRAESQ